MRHHLVNALMFVSAVPVVYAYLVDFGAHAIAGSIIHYLVYWGPVLGWLMAVVLAAVKVKGPAWCLRPAGLLTLSWILAAGAASLVFLTYLSFAIFLLITFAGSVVAVVQSKKSDADEPAFCRRFALCTWLGLSLLLTVTDHWTGVSMIQESSWYMTDYGAGWSLPSALRPNHGAGWWSFCLLCVWPVALSVAWFTRKQFSWANDSSARTPAITRARIVFAVHALIGLGCMLGLYGYLNTRSHPTGPTEDFYRAAQRTAFLFPAWIGFEIVSRIPAWRAAVIIAADFVLACLVYIAVDELLTRY